MILTEMAPAWIRICLILVLVSGGFLLSSRNLINLVRTYQVQSSLLVLIALGLMALEQNMVLLLVAALTLISKVFGIPYCIGFIQKRMSLKQDLTFSYLHPPGALMLSILIILLVYICFSRILESLYAANSLFFLGSVIGVSLVLMGLIAVCTRKMAISKVLGYLSMEMESSHLVCLSQNFRFSSSLSSSSISLFLCS
jgi:hydrogenase-4 component E